MATHKVTWFDFMGAAPVTFEATFDTKEQRVRVDGENLAIMAAGWLQEGPLDADDNAAAARGILSSPRDVGDGLYDVTASGGGWLQWMDDSFPDGPPWDITEEQSAIVKAVLAFAKPKVAKAIAKAYPLEWDEYHEERAREAAARPPYTDHNGEPTADPRCELGLCVSCIDDSLARGGVEQRVVFIVPSLSIADPAYGKSEAYRAKVHAAFKALGVEYRESADR